MKRRGFFGWAAGLLGFGALPLRLRTLLAPEATTRSFESWVTASGAIRFRIVSTDGSVCEGIHYSANRQGTPPAPQHPEAT